MKKKSELQKLLDEVSDFLSSLGEELQYWTGAFAKSIIKEFEQLLQELFAKFTGGFIPPMDFDLDDIIEDDVACRRYGPQMVRMPK